MINYSIIIPHKNTPDLLQRCLDSIPIRDDIQVIVIDDNSDVDKVDFEFFPRWKGNHYEYYLTKEGKGAGYARNVGLQHAVGKWLVFADADDFFTDDLHGLMDETVGAEEDLVYFDYKNVLSEDISKEVEARTWYRACFFDYLKGKEGSEEKLRTSVVVPWCKLIKRDLVESHSVRFEEVKWGNDVFFSTLIAIKARKISFNKIVAYVLTERKDSLASDFIKSMKELKIRLMEAVKSDELFKANGFHKTDLSIVLLNYALDKFGFWWLVRFEVFSFSNCRVSKATLSFLKSIVKKKMTKHLKIQ